MRHLRIPLLLLIGLGLGLGLGLYLGWEAYPTEFVNASPVYLSDQHKQDYVRMVAAAYTVDGDLAAAQERLTALGEEGTAILTAVMLDAILQAQNINEINQLVNLAQALDIYSPAMDPYLAAPTGEVSP